MKKHSRILLLLFFVLLAGMTKAQTLFLNFPSTVHICDIKNFEMQADIEYVTNNLFDIELSDDHQKYWRYTFEWYDQNGVRIGDYNSFYGQYFDTPKSHKLKFSDHPFETGNYKVVFKVYKLDPQVNGGEVLVFSQSKTKMLTVTGLNLNWDAGRVRGMVSGDFDQDGFEDEVLACYDHGANTTDFYVWTSDATEMHFGWSWYSSNQFNANNVEGRFVAGDFDRNGIKDDVAAIYDYGNNQTKIHVWHSNGSAMIYQGAWWANTGSGATGYDANKISGRLVAGDFDEDGFEDDLAAMYDYGSNNMQIHVWEENQGGFTYGGPWFTSAPNNFNAAQVTGRIISGDFDSDGKAGDIIAYYEYPNNQTKAFLWKSTGTSLNGKFTWYDSGLNNYNAALIKGRVVSADFDHDGNHDDIATFYDFGGNETRMHYWRGDVTTLTGAWTPYNSGAGMFDASAITNKTVSGDFDRDGFVDNIVTMYQYSNEKAKLFLWRGIGAATTAWYQEVWQVCGSPYNKQGNAAVEIEEQVENQAKLATKIYPNPSQGSFKIDLMNQETGTMNLYAYDGRKVKISQLNAGVNQVDVQDQPAGVYIVEIIANQSRTTQKLIIR